MFPLQHSDDWLFEDIPSLVFQTDSVLDPSLSFNPIAKESKKRSQAGVSKSDIQENKDDEKNNECKNKKVVHRDIERQRRREMATLYASLRTLLPSEYIKGKRAISDHMNEAVNYIKHMERNMKELRIRRDKLKNLCNSDGSAGNIGSSNSAKNAQNSVTISSCQDATVEILISCGIKEEEEGFPLSKVMVLLLQTGLNVFSCVSTKANEIFLCRIQSQASDSAYIDLPTLQRRLTNLINSGENYLVVDQNLP